MFFVGVGVAQPQTAHPFVRKRTFPLSRGIPDDPKIMNKKSVAIKLL